MAPLTRAGGGVVFIVTVPVPICVGPKGVVAAVAVVGVGSEAVSAGVAELEVPPGVAPDAGTGAARG